jgi:hypothetical protein
MLFYSPVEFGAEQCMELISNIITSNPALTGIIVRNDQVRLELEQAIKDLILKPKSLQILYVKPHCQGSFIDLEPETL